RNDRNNGNWRNQTWDRNRQDQYRREEQNRIDAYRQNWNQQQNYWRQREAILQRERRNYQYRYSLGYLERLRQQQLRYQNWRFIDNSYYYGAPIYRYSYGGSYYTINEYGAGLLRNSVNAGYSEGF